MHIARLLIFDADIVETAGLGHQVNLIQVQPGALRWLEVQLIGAENNLSAIYDRAMYSRSKMPRRFITGTQQVNAVRNHHLIASGKVALQRLTQVGDFQLFVIQGNRRLQKVFIKYFADRMNIGTDDLQQFKTLGRRATQGIQFADSLIELTGGFTRIGHRKTFGPLRERLETRTTKRQLRLSCIWDMQCNRCALAVHAILLLTG